MTKARDIADFKFENITDIGTAGTRVALGTTAQRGSTTGQFRYNSTTNKFEGRNAEGSFVTLEANPVVSSVNSNNITQKQINDGFDIVITGENFATGDTVKFIGNDSTEFNSPTVTVNSTTQITARITSTIDATLEPYKIQVTSALGNQGSLSSAFNIDAAPAFSTAAGNLGTNEEGTSVSYTIAATDAEGDAITFAETGGSVLSTNGLTLASGGGITGTAPTVSGSTTLSFDVRATSGTNFTDRTFNIIIVDGPTGGTTGTYSYGGVTYKFNKFTSNANFVLGVAKTVDIFVLGGGAGTAGDNAGGGGSGGLIWLPNKSLAAGTYAVVIGNGGTGSTAGSQTSSTNGGNSTFGTILTALGGGYGGTSSVQAANGGSGGGEGRETGQGHTAGLAQQPNQVGDNAGLGNNGGTTQTTGSTGPGSGGGGTGAAGANGTSGNVGNGGNGSSTFISSNAAQTTAFLLGTTSGTDASNNATTGSSTGTLYIGGGGSGGTQDRGSHSGGGTGGLGGGANIGSSSDGNDGLVNTGSGGSSTTSGGGTGGDGGSGLVIVRYT